MTVRDTEASPGPALPALFPAEEGWVLPAYDGGSIANLPATIAALFGCELPGSLPPLGREAWADWAPRLRRVVLVVVDGLGLALLGRMGEIGEGRAFAELPQAGRMVPLTSVFPSTTSAALTSLSTGRPPAEHGWLAFEIYLRELGVAANAIFLSPIWSRQHDLLVDWGLNPETMVPFPTLAQRLSKAGIGSRALLSAMYAGSGFTTMLYRGAAELRTHRHASDLWVHLRHLLAETRGRRTYISVYWGALDTLGHAYGPGGEEWLAEFRSLDNLLRGEFLSRLPAADREGTLLLITADHGQIDVPPEHAVTVADEPALHRHLWVPPMGESRAAFLYPRPGRPAAIRDALQSKYPGRFLVLESAEVLEAGLMGRPVSDETYARAGELIVLPRAGYALQRARPPTPLLGRHGGLTPGEMLVPLIGARLEAVP